MVRRRKKPKDPSRDIARELRNLGITGTWEHVRVFLEEEVPKPERNSRYPFSMIRERVENIKHKIEQGTTLEDFENATKSRWLVWEHHIDAGLAAIVKRAKADEKLSKGDIDRFVEHVKNAKRAMEQINENYKRTQILFPADYPWAIAMRNLFDKILKNPEVYANLLYIHSKYGKVSPELIKAERSKLFVHKKARKPRL